MSDKLLEFQHAVKTWLDAQPYFSGAGQENAVPIVTVTDDVGDLESEVNRGLDMAGGLCVLIRMPEGKLPHKDAGVPVYDPATLHIRIYENATLNRAAGGTGEPAGLVAGALIALLWTFADAVPQWNVIVPVARGWGVEVDPATRVATPYYDVFFETTIALDLTTPTRGQAILTESGDILTTEDNQNLDA